MFKGRIRGSIQNITGWFWALAIAQILGTNTSATAADTVVVRFGLFAESIAVADLQKAAETGKFPRDLESFTNRLSEQDRNLILGALRTKLPLNVVTISRLLNTQIGTTILNDLATALVRKDQAGAQALRAGFVLGSTAPQGLSILSFIKAYPSQRLEINLPQAFAVASNLNSGFWVTQQFMLAIAPQFNPTTSRLAFPFDPGLRGNEQFQILGLQLNDQKRNRKIPADIYWSNASTAEKPVIVFSHGFGSVRTDMRYLAEHLASHGYIVVALEHPGSNATYTNLAIKNNTRLIQPQEFLERPKDISFILDELEKLNQKPNQPLQGKIAADNAMVIGYSFGGGTALSIAGAELQLENLKQRCKKNVTGLSFGETLQCVAQELPANRYQLGDTRIKRAIALSPTTSLMFGKNGLSKLQIPTLIWAASADKTVPALPEQFIGFKEMPSPKWLVGVLGGTHLSVKDPSTTLDQEQRLNTPLSGGEVVGEQAADIRKYLQAIALSFAAQLTPEAEKYAVFLTPDYAQFASTQAFPIRLVTQIPPQAMFVLRQFISK
ncbi:alpha/beta hydrolase [Tolypothrix sp. FACHB-123]|uniref:alpha/beta hydrolase n=1 Tax=Tolypothrix sp. FACHB-123 TaxID=2692868 RepID=UPI001687E2C1|nr:alpha/beta hydrolase [Tolypothrix sp. FACHB-123]MBD2355374.1 alpha/beta hydrolase [Tolypothrix sp. FACHB-123]